MILDTSLEYLYDSRCSDDAILLHFGTFYILQHGSHIDTHEALNNPSLPKSRHTLSNNSITETWILNLPLPKSLLTMATSTES